MNITITREGKELTAKVSGRLDTLTSPMLGERLEPQLEDTEKLVFDLSELSYLSGAVLRVLVGAARIMAGRGKIILRNMKKPVEDALNIAGLTGSFIIE